MKLNAAGDLVVDSAPALEALVEPGTVDLLDRLRRDGPLTADDLGTSESRLMELQRLGFVTREAGRWAGVGRGIYFEIPAAGDGQREARELTKLLLLRETDRPRRWAEESEPGLSVEWARAAGMFNARIRLTAEELRSLQDELERMLEPYTSREQPPTEASPVRLLAFFLPEGVSDTS